MSANECAAPLAFDELVDYTAGELSAEGEAELEAHYFGCERCARRLASVEAIGAAVARAVRGGAVRASITERVVERLERAGLRLRRYAVGAGEVVPCTVAPNDDFVLIELTSERPGSARAFVEVAAHDAAGAALAAERSWETAFDLERGAIRLLFPAEVVRAYPRSRWTMHVRFEAETIERVGPFTLEHSPWPAPGEG